jgi:hypothetical protein
MSAATQAPAYKKTNKAATSRVWNRAERSPEAVVIANNFSWDLWIGGMETVARPVATGVGSHVHMPSWVTKE